MKFKYEKFTVIPTVAFPRRKFMERPAIPLKILNEGKVVCTIALIDSGADWCIFDAELGELIGINVRSGEEQDFYGLNSEKPGTLFFHQISLEIGGIAIDVRAGFTYDISHSGMQILGQEGFFDEFDVTFKRRKKVVELKPIA